MFVNNRHFRYPETNITGFKLSGTRLRTTLHHCRLILETETESGTKSRFQYLCIKVVKKMLSLGGPTFKKIYFPEKVLHNGLNTRVRVRTNINKQWYQCKEWQISKSCAKLLLRVSGLNYFLIFFNNFWHPAVVA